MKLFRLALVSSSLVFALGTAQASDTAVINLSATVSPGSCEIGASSLDLDVGSIAFSDLQQEAMTSLAFEENTSITITCTALHQGVYFTVQGADGDLGEHQFSLGNFDGTTVNAGFFQLEPANPVFTFDGPDVVPNNEVLCRDGVAGEANACPGAIRSDRQYTFASVTADGINAMTFDLDGTLSLPSLNALAAAGLDTSEVQNFATSFTVTAVF